MIADRWLPVVGLGALAVAGAIAAYVITHQKPSRPAPACGDDMAPLRASCIDRDEVTAGAYARCAEAGACPPAPPDAAAYCVWAGKRTPTREERELAPPPTGSGLGFRCACDVLGCRR